MESLALRNLDRSASNRKDRGEERQRMQRKEGNDSFAFFAAFLCALGG